MINAKGYTFSMEYRKIGGILNCMEGNYSPPNSKVIDMFTITPCLPLPQLTLDYILMQIMKKITPIHLPGLN